MRWFIKTNKALLPYVGWKIVFRTILKDCAADVYLPVNNFKWLPELPSQEYFFAEGKGQHYAQAEYAEYRFKNGILLLARLLDKDLKAL